MMSGRRDSNPRPPAPKAGALTELRYAPLQISKFLFASAKVIKLFQIPTFYAYFLKNLELYAVNLLELHSFSTFNNSYSKDKITKYPQKIWETLISKYSSVNPFIYFFASLLS